MATPTSPAAPSTPDPYTSTETSTFEISNVKIAVTRTVNASHPPKPCNCHGQAGMLEAMIMQLAQRFASPPDAGSPPPDASSAH